MPIGTPKIKVDSVERLGGKYVTVHIDGETFDDAQALCKKFADDNDLVYVPPFDNPYVIAGQGTIAMEILEQISQSPDIPVQVPDAVFVQIGGGGLAAGICQHIKGKVNPLPDTKVIGVEGYGQAAMTESLAAGRPVTLNEVDPFADGTAVKKPGKETFNICKKYLDPKVVLVSNDEICAAIKDIFDGASMPSSCSLRQAHCMLMDSQTPALLSNLRVPLPLPVSKYTLLTTSVRGRNLSPSSAVPI